MEDLTTSVTGTAQTITNVIFWLTDFAGKIITGIGAVEIVIGLLIGIAIYFSFRQHNLEPRKVYKF